MSKSDQPAGVAVDRGVRPREVPLPGGLRLTVTERCELYDWRDECVDAAERAACAALEDECKRTDSLLTILGLPAERCRSEGGSLMPRKALTLMAEAGHPPRFSELDCELLGNGLAYIIREYPEKAEHARTLLQKLGA